MRSIILLRKGKVATTTTLIGARQLLVAVSQSVWALTVAYTISRCNGFCSIQLQQQQNQQYAAARTINIVKNDVELFQQIQQRMQLQPRHFSSLPRRKRSTQASSSLIVRNMAVGPRQNRGLEQNREQATPLPGGMELYLKAGPDNVSVGDCPFAHYVRLVLEEKQLEYTLRPCIQSTKPKWLIDYYDGKMPALRHRKECYVESDVIVSYLEFFFPNTSLSPTSADRNNELAEKAEKTIDGLFPLIAKYIRYSKDGDETDMELLQNLHDGLNRLDDHFVNNVLPTITSIGGDNDNNNQQLHKHYYLTGTKLTTLDCSLIPKLYHMQIACNEIKGNKLHIPSSVQTYINTMIERESFQRTVYPPEVIVWGWNNARK